MLKKILVTSSLVATVGLSFVSCGSSDTKTDSETSFYESETTQQKLVAIEVDEGYCTAVIDPEQKSHYFVSDEPVSEDHLRRALQVDKYTSHVIWGTIGAVPGAMLASVAGFASGAGALAAGGAGQATIAAAIAANPVSSGLIVISGAALIGGQIVAGAVASQNTGDDATSWVVSLTRLVSFTTSSFLGGFPVIGADLAAERIARDVRMNNLLKDEAFRIKDSRFQKHVRLIEDLPTLEGDCRILDDHMEKLY